MTQKKSQKNRKKIGKTNNSKNENFICHYQSSTRLLSKIVFVCLFIFCLYNANIFLLILMKRIEKEKKNLAWFEWYGVSNNLWISRDKIAFSSCCCENRMFWLSERPAISFSTSTMSFVGGQTLCIQRIYMYAWSTKHGLFVKQIAVLWI